MPTLKKVKTVVWEDANGNRVKAGTLGATKRTIKSSNWYIIFKENKKVFRIPTVPDHSAAKAMLGDFIRARAHGKAGLIDPHKKYFEQPILELVEEYHAYTLAHSRSDKHPSEVRRILKAIVASTKYGSIKEISPNTLAKYLTSMTQKAGTKNMHRRIMVSFCNWFEGQGYIPNNPIGGKKVKTFKPKTDEKKRKRRALTTGELHRLLAVAQEQPLKDASRSRGGRPRKDGSKTASPKDAELKPETIQAKIEEGRERKLLYQLAVYTGLRRKELSRLLVQHLHLNGVPKVHIPGSLTKNGKDATIPLPPLSLSNLRRGLPTKGRSRMIRLFTFRMDRISPRYTSDCLK